MFGFVFALLFLSPFLVVRFFCCFFFIFNVCEWFELSCTKLFKAQLRSCVFVYWLDSFFLFICTFLSPLLEWVFSFDVILIWNSSIRPFFTRMEFDPLLMNIKKTRKRVAYKQMHYETDRWEKKEKLRSKQRLECEKKENIQSIRKA